MEKPSPKETKKITLGLLASWFFSIVFLLNALGFGVSGSYKGSAIFFLAGLILLPPFNTLIADKFNIHISRPLKVIIAIVAPIIALIVLVKEAPEDNNAVSNTESQVAAEEEKNAPVAEEEQVPVYALGDAINDNDLMITVEKVEDKGKSLQEQGCEYYCSTIEADGKILMVLFSVTNNDDEPRDVYTPKLVDSKDREFQRSTAYGDFGPEGYSELSFDSLNPGNSKKFYALYDVAENSSGFKWQRVSPFLEELQYEVDFNL